MLLWLATAALASVGLITLIGRRPGVRRPGPGADAPRGVGSRAVTFRDVGVPALAGAVGSLVSISAGVLAAAVTMDPEEGATFIAIPFWLAGPPVSAVAIALVVRIRQWDPPAIGVRAGVAFTTCVLCGLVALAAASPRSPAPPVVEVPGTTDLGPVTSDLPE